MPVYGNEVLNEAVFFISKDGKELKKELKEKLKEFRIKGLGNVIKAGFKTDYNTEIQKKSLDLIKSTINVITTSIVFVETVTTTVNGVTTVQDYYYQEIYGFRKNKFYRIRLYLTPSSSNISVFEELDLNGKCVIPEKVFKLITDAYENKGYIFIFKEKKVYFESISSHPADCQLITNNLVDKINNGNYGVNANFGRGGKSITFYK